MTNTQEAVQDVLDRCTIEGNVVFLPENLDRNIYVEVNKKLTGIGGKWNRKEKGHVFDVDPSELLGRVLDGENINLKKDFQFFETPKDLAQELVSYASNGRDLKITLEPSAGRGAIIDEILKQGTCDLLFACELMETNSKILADKYSSRGDVSISMNADFLKMDSYLGLFDTIIANPPFTKNQDIDHVLRMYDCLKPGGRLVSITSGHWEFASGKKEENFRNWIDQVGATYYEIEKGAFKDSGTMVGGFIIIADK